jgi:hypothetical protein
MLAYHLKKRGRSTFFADVYKIQINIYFTKLSVHSGKPIFFGRPFFQRTISHWRNLAVKGCRERRLDVTNCTSLSTTMNPIDRKNVLFKIFREEKT